MAEIDQAGRRCRSSRSERAALLRRGRTFGAFGGALGADPLDGLCGGAGLGRPSRRPFARAEHFAVDPDLDPERLLVVRTRRFHEPVVGPLAGSPLCVFLQP